MKGFARAETRFSLCGLNCALCSMQLGGYCPGCGGGAENQSCAIAKCSLEHGGIQFYWECPEYPCSRYEGFDDGDSFVPHRSRKQDIASARKMGMEAYLAQLEEKRTVLDALLADYNDGRRKTLERLIPLWNSDLQAHRILMPGWRWWNRCGRRFPDWKPARRWRSIEPPFWIL